MSTKKTICALATAFVAVMLAAALPAAEQSQEIAGRALLGEAEKLMELALPQEALPVLEQVKTAYAGTEAASYAELRKAQSLMFLKRYDEAISVASAIVADTPGTVRAAWAQCVVGQCMVSKGNTAQGIVELKKVAEMLPGTGEFGPLSEAREVMGRVCAHYLVDKTDDLDAAQVLGLDRSKPADKAKVLAILAAHRARNGNYASARTTLDRLVSECSDQGAEVAWARAEAGMLSLKVSGEDAAAAEQDLLLVSANSAADNQQAAKVDLALARKFRKEGNTARAAEVLEQAKAKYAGTANAAEISYELGGVLYQLNRKEEANAALAEVIDDTPNSGYAAPALYAMGCNNTGEARLQALTRLAEGGYDIRWRGLAYWKLGSLHGANDKTGAAECFNNAIVIFQDCLVTQKADIHSDWRQMLEARIESIRSQMRGLGIAEEVAQ